MCPRGASLRMGGAEVSRRPSVPPKDDVFQGLADVRKQCRRGACSDPSGVAKRKTAPRHSSARGWIPDPSFVTCISTSFALALVVAVLRQLAPPLDRMSNPSTDQTQGRDALVTAAVSNGSHSRGHASAIQFQSRSAKCSARDDADFAQLVREERKLRIYIAADLHNAEGVIRHWVLELLFFVKQLPKENVFVSVYDSASTDATPAWIRTLDRVLSYQGIPHRVVTDAAGGRLQGQHRIDFMATIRNKALEPLGVFAGYERNLLRHDGSGQDTFAPPRTRVPTIPPTGGGTFDRVVFLNDVFFCARDIVRLLVHNADVACGMDYDLNVPYMRAWLEREPQFYDTWVARDMEGRQLAKAPPHFRGSGDQRRLREGRPIQVQCCWNGIAVMNAEPFHKGLRFRHVVSGDECKASECSHICNDMWRNGYGRILVDPLVKVAYTHHEWMAALDRAAPYMGGKAVPTEKITYSHEPPKHVTCCTLERDTDSRKLGRCEDVDTETTFQSSPCLCRGNNASCTCSWAQMVRPY